MRQIAGIHTQFTSRARPWRTAGHALAVAAGFTAVFVWVYWRSIADAVYPVESDLYEYFFPIFLAPFTTWSAFEFAGIPVFADPNEPFAYPLYLLVSSVTHSWIAFIISAHVLAACGMFAYVKALTGSNASALVSGLAFALSEAMIEKLAHITSLHSIAWMPWVFLCIERLLRTGSHLWTGLGSLAVANAILAGHPQPAFYTCVAAVAYAIVGGRAEGRPRRYYVQVALLFAVAGAIAAIKLVPFVQVTTHMARDVVSFGHFANYGNTPAQMWSMIFPTVLHDGREAPTYVGLATVVLAMSSATLWRQQWRVAFWMAACLVAVLFGVGDATPFAQLVFDYVPLYDKFRVGARHLVIACFALTTLAGFGLHLAVVENRRRPVVTSVLVFSLLFSAGLWFMTHRPAGFEVENRYPFAWSQHGLPPVMSNELWTQTMLAAATVITVIGVGLARRKVPFVALLAVLVIADLINGQSFQVSRRGIDSVTMPASAMRPNVHVEKIASELAPGHQRMLDIGGTTRDPMVPAVWARLWQVPIAGGYGPMLLERHSLLSSMGRNGSVRNAVLSSHDQALNLLAVNTIVMRPSDVGSQGTFDADGLTWEKEAIDAPVGRADCGNQYPRSLDLTLPRDVEIVTLHAVMFMRCAEHVPQGALVATIVVVAEDGQRHEQQLRAGEEVAETALSDDKVLARARHRRPRSQFADPGAPDLLRSLVTMRLPSPARATRLKIDATGFGGWLTLSRLTLVDRDGRARPQVAGETYLRDATRWKEMRRIRTSRYGDRGRDDDAASDQEYTIYQNLRAMPRAWLAPSVEVMKLASVLPTIRAGQLPDGRAFRPDTTALIAEEDGSPTERHFGTRASTVRIERVENGRVGIEVSSADGGFLVLSETYYPGWTATIDGASTDVFRTNLSLQGIVVPPGDHLVDFGFRPYALYAGALFSALGLCIVGLLVSRRHASRPEALGLEGGTDVKK